MFCSIYNAMGELYYIQVYLEARTIVVELKELALKILCIKRMSFNFGK